MKIAVCLYGQFRTGAYCLPWIREQYAFADADFFVHTKAYSTYSNDLGQQDSPLRVTYPDSVKHQLSLHLGHKLMWSKVIGVEDEIHRPDRGYWNYTLMFSSLQQAVYAALDLHSDRKYDVLVAQRLDMLVGPHVTSFSEAAAHYTRSHTVFTLNPEMRFMPEGMQAGIHDVFLAGTVPSMNLLVAQTFEATCNPRTNDWKRYVFEGPNVFLRKAATQAGLHLNHARLGFALVRPKADLTIPVLESYAYHEKYWSQNHVRLSE